jgi:predicted deacylase
MSIAEIKRFAADLKSNPALRAEAEKSQADKSHAASVARSVAFAASKGYGFTLEEAKHHVQARAAAKGKVVTDAELDGMAGGSDWLAAIFVNPFDSWCYST